MLTKVHCNICLVCIINNVHEEIESIKDFFSFHEDMKPIL